jgi:hypothetical protein
MFIPFKLPVSLMPTLIDVNEVILLSGECSATTPLDICDLVGIIGVGLGGFKV